MVVLGATTVEINRLASFPEVTASATSRTLSTEVGERSDRKVEDSIAKLSDRALCCCALGDFN